MADNGPLNFDNVTRISKLKINTRNKYECAKDLEELRRARDQFLRQKAKCTSKEVSNINQRVVQAGQCLKREHCDILNVTVTAEEIKEAVFAIPGTKALGPDGPIACCNTIYKCLSKVLCARLGQVLPDVVSASQNAFIKGRDIVGNILICQDLIKLYKRKSCSPRIMMKLDLQKAYNSVEWCFMEGMMKAIRFPDMFTQLVMQCITTPYSISLNGDMFGFFKGKRGLI
ncbi:uncharacterized protein LOC141651365 [Silene latifolia]|uniref:uncharacterized protein LOC141651365 n=1 Tax=Silene latifolia TaxID=37657 RepID=UPI003D786A17